MSDSMVSDIKLKKAAKKQAKKEAKLAAASASAAAAEKKAAKKAAKRALKAASEGDQEDPPRPAKKIKSNAERGDIALAESKLVSIQDPLSAPSSSSAVASFTSFQDLYPKIHAQLKPSLSSFEKPSDIQASVWPFLLQGRDVVGIAETGSGKTLAFGIPALDLVLTSNEALAKRKHKKNSPPPQVLILAPTRELALQTLASLTPPTLQNLGISTICLFGGMSKAEQVKEYNSNSPQVIVATPGRLKDLAINDSAVDLSAIKYLVLDEADRMLDQGFEKDIRDIINLTPSARQTLMFSATWPQSIRTLAEKFMKDPVRITIGSSELSANVRVEQLVEVIGEGQSMDTRQISKIKEDKLLSHLRKSGLPTGSRVLIFALYKLEAARIEQFMKRQGFAVGAIHGDLNQVQRMKALEEFKSGRVPYLVATDVAARGLDIPNVELVLNMTFPLTIEDYIHRIGRTGRGGKSGKSITYFSEFDKSHAGELMRLLRDGGFEIPSGLAAFPSTIKKKEHGAYGAHFREIPEGEMKKAKKILFD